MEQTEQKEIRLRPCPACSNMVSSQAVSCPQCGHPLQQSQTFIQEQEKKGLGFWGVVLAIVVAVVILSIV